jgi:hypothetical protein
MRQSCKEKFDVKLFGRKSMLHSFHYPIAKAQFPEYTGQQHYMARYNPRNHTNLYGYGDMAAIVAATFNIKDTIFVTIDEKIIQPGMSQRRPGPHVDGCFTPADEAMEIEDEEIVLDPATRDALLHGPYGFYGGGWGHGGGGWNHSCNRVPFKRMPVAVAATVAGCRVWDGSFDAEPQNDGDLSHIWEQLGEGFLLPANKIFLLSPDCVHESVIFNQPTQRQFVRFALPVETAI